VRIQIAVALIAFLLLSLLRKMAKDQPSLLEITRLVRANLMHRRTSPASSNRGDRRARLAATLLNWGCS